MSGTEKKVWAFLEKFPWFLLGLAATAFLVLPYLVLGSKCYIQINDQLDGEVLNYIYRAKYLFSGENIIPEFMNGMNKAAMTPPAPIGVLFYKVLPPFAAFAAMHVFVVMVGYVGMYRLCRLFTQSSLISFVAAGIFVYLPFYPVYGLSILGQPLLAWAVIKYCEKELSLAQKIKYGLCILLYAVSSSLALAGFTWIALLFFVWLWSLWKKQKEVSRGVGISLLLLTAGFLLCNVELLGSLLGIGESYVAHREEMVLAAISDWRTSFEEIFLEGGAYGKSYNGMIVLLTAAVIVLYPVSQVIGTFRRGEKTGIFQKIAGSVPYRMVAAGFVLALLVSVAAVLWRTPRLVDVRMQLGGVCKSFQADRIYWILPLCWYTLLALDLFLLLKEWRKWWILRYGAAVAVLAALCFQVYENSTIYHNLRLMIFPDTYHLMNWDDYYAKDVYDQIDDFLGEDKSSYRTLSLGITPAAALYNGFYCLDGYSNYYSLDYKHEFREIIEKELAKAEEVRVYFDTWGNRCYLFNAETGNYMMIPGYTTAVYENLELNTRKMYEMGGRYLFAAMPVQNAEEMGLALVREEPFETADSYYRIWVYAIRAE
ncbi:MAG: DUF6044 family protein [Candidatus Gastranaerophilales bacterium]|nr:DUF6044 family protein [Candidatus Gastranaerophilales bacterium]